MAVEGEGGGYRGQVGLRGGVGFTEVGLGLGRWGGITEDRWFGEEGWV